jgi:hypothetical protein
LRNRCSGGRIGDRAGLRRARIDARWQVFASEPAMQLKGQFTGLLSKYVFAMPLDLAPPWQPQQQANPCPHQYVQTEVE